MLRRTIVVLLWFPCLTMAEDVSFSYGAEQYYWEEFDHQDGHSLLLESGIRHVFSVSAEKILTSSWRTSAAVKFYTASIDYDGETQARIPAFSTTEYTGWNVEVDTNRILNDDSYDRWLLTLALGHERWNRDILDGKTIYGQPVAGYAEDYAVSYVRLGTKLERGNEWRLSGGLKYPFHIEESVGFSRFGYDDPQLTPKGAVSLYGSVGYSFATNWSLDLRYDSYRFNPSDWKFLTVNGVSVDQAPFGVCDPYECVSQPKSYQDSIMLMLSFDY